MRRTRKEQELEKKLISEEYNPVTLEDREETENLLIEDKESEQEREQAAQIVRDAYSKVTNGHAIIRTQCAIIVLISEFVFGMAIPAFFIVLFFYEKWYFEPALIFTFLVFVSGSFGSAFIGYWFFLRTVKKLFDVYYFQQGKKRIIIYKYCK